MSLVDEHRIIPFMPQAPIKETLMWKTNVFISFDGSERREAIRQFPRLSYNYRIPVNAEFKRSHVYHAVSKGIAMNDWLIPMWWEFQYVEISAGKVLTVDSRPWPLEVGDRLFIVDYVKQQNFLVSEITALTNTQITVMDTIPAMQRPIGMPIRVGYIDNRASLQTIGGFIGEADILFTLSEPVRMTTDERFGGTPVYNEPYLIGGGVVKQVAQTVSTVDYGRLVARRERWTMPKAYYQMGFRQHNLCDHAGFRKFLHQQRGRERAFWLPSFETDLVPVRDDTEVGTTLKVRDYSYNDTDMHRSCIAIKDVKGNWHYRRITANNTTAGVVSLTLDTALALRHGQINYISYLGKHRITGDRIQIEHGQGRRKECSLRVAEIDDDCENETSWYSQIISTGCYVGVLPREGRFRDTRPIPKPGEGSGPGPVPPPPPPDEDIDRRDIFPIVYPNPTIDDNGEERDDFFAPGAGYELVGLGQGTAALRCLYASRLEAVFVIGDINGYVFGQRGTSPGGAEFGTYFAFMHWTRGGGVRNVWGMIAAYNIFSIGAGPGGFIYAGGDDKLLAIRPPTPRSAVVNRFFTQGSLSLGDRDNVQTNSFLRDSLILLGVPTNIPTFYGRTYTQADTYPNFTVRDIVDNPTAFGGGTLHSRAGVFVYLPNASLSESFTHVRTTTYSVGSVPVVSPSIRLNDRGRVSSVYEIYMIGMGRGFTAFDRDGARLLIWGASGGDPVVVDVSTDPLGPSRGGDVIIQSSSVPIGGPSPPLATNTGFVYLYRTYRLNFRGAPPENTSGFSLLAAYSLTGVRTPSADIPYVWYRPITTSP